MKIAVNLVGISHNKDEKMGSSERDWNLSKYSIKEKVIDCWKEYGDVDVYVTTYNSEIVDELLEFYKPKVSTIIDFDVHKPMQLTHLESFSKIKDCDLIVSTRFDIEFHKKLSDYDTIDYKKINFLFRDAGRHWESYRYVCDNLYIFPIDYLEIIKKSIKDEFEQPFSGHREGLHPIYNHIVKYTDESNINFLSQQDEQSHICSHYQLSRKLKN
jgi:hypothetical protein